MTFNRKRKPIIYGDGEHDDTEGVNALLTGERVENRSGIAVFNCRFSGKQTIVFPADTVHRLSKSIDLRNRKIKLRKVK